MLFWGRVWSGFHSPGIKNHAEAALNQGGSLSPARLTSHLKSGPPLLTHFCAFDTLRLGGCMDKTDPLTNSTMAAPVAILGVPFDSVTTSETIEIIARMIESGEPHYIATANVDFLVQAAKDVELRRILFDAHLVLCDGTPLLWASRLLGNELPERVAGSDVVPLLLKEAAEKGYRVYFLGAQPVVCAQAVEKLRAQFPALQIVGHHSPPFKPLVD